MLNFKEINPYYKKVTLIGMMGTGKSKFGRQIANILKYNFYDIDHMIEKEFNITIKKIFHKHGEVFFREIEKKTIRDLILKINKNREKVIISLGGGGFRAHWLPSVSEGTCPIGICSFCLWHHSTWVISVGA